MKMVVEHCYNHPNVAATATCGMCHQYICKACTVSGECPQCAGFFPLPNLNCTIHPDEPAEFMCMGCGKSFCKLEKHELQHLSGTSHSAFHTVHTEIQGCRSAYSCSYAKDFRNRSKVYHREYEEYIKKNKNAKCPKCGKKMELARRGKGLKSSKRFTCTNCNDFIKFISSIEEWNGLDDPELIKTATMPAGSTQPLKAQSEGIYCSQCGAAISPGSKFCNKCGEKVAP